MSRKMKIETTIANLKKMHDSYQQEVAHLEQQFAAVSTQLERYRNLVSRTSESIDALEGRGIKVQLQEALQGGSTRTEPLDGAVGAVTLRGGSFPLPANLPPAERGFHWERNEIGEWVLIAGVTQKEQIITHNALIELPPILDDEEFGDKPTDFII